MKSWKSIGAAVLSLAIVFSLSSCSTKPSSSSSTSTSSAKQVVKLKVWAPTEEQNILVTMCNNFAQLHPDETFQFTYAVMGVDKSIDTLKKDASAAADVFLYPSGGIPEMTAAGLIMPITYNASEITDENTAPAINSCSYQGKLYGVPEAPNTWFLFYNKSMYTADDVKSLDTMMAKKLATGVKNFSVDITNSWYNAAWFYGAGCTLYGKDGTDATQCDWNSSTGLAVADYLYDLAHNSKFVNDTASGLAGTLMKEGKLAAFCSGTWSAADLKKSLGNNYAATVLPTYTLNGKQCQLESFVDYRAFGVNAMTKYPKESEELAEYLGAPDSELLRFEKCSYAPTDKTLFSNPTVAANVEDTALAQETALSAPQPKSAQLSEYWTPSGALGSDIVNNKVTKATMQSDLDKFVKAVTTVAVK